ncbi:hypothetical protein O9929_14495 [Vibrio lentus]|nr:hypothetical protein [Vibrio lentus]
MARAFIEDGGELNGFFSLGFVGWIENGFTLALRSKVSIVFQASCIEYIAVFTIVVSAFSASILSNTKQT